MVAVRQRTGRGGARTERFGSAAGTERGRPLRGIIRREACFCDHPPAQEWMRSINTGIDDGNCYASAIRFLLRQIGVNQCDAARQVRHRQCVFDNIRRQRVVCQTVQRTSII